MAFNINDIRANLKFGGARPTLFQVILDTPFDRNIGNVTPFMCRASSIPASVINPIEVPYFGRMMKVAGDRTFENWNVQIYNDEDFKIRHAMETWHSRINSLRRNVNETGSARPDAYKTDAEVLQYSKIGGAPIRRYKYFGLFPVSVSEIELAWEAQNQIQIFSVQFAYDYYEVVGGTTGAVN